MRNFSYFKIVLKNDLIVNQCMIKNMQKLKASPKKVKSTQHYDNWKPKGRSHLFIGNVNWFCFNRVIKYYPQVFHKNYYPQTKKDIVQEKK